MNLASSCSTLLHTVFHHLSLHNLIETNENFLAHKMLDLFPVCAFQTSHGWLPLHVVCIFQPNNLVLINRLLKIHPEGALQKTPKGSYPLHLICTYGGPYYRSIRQILQAGVEVASYRAVIAQGKINPLMCQHNINILQLLGYPWKL